MTLKDLKPVLVSGTGRVTQVIVYHYETDTNLEYGCSVDYAVKRYADREVRRIWAHNDFLVISV